MQAGSGLAARSGLDLLWLAGRRRPDRFTGPGGGDITVRRPVVRRGGQLAPAMLLSARQAWTNPGRSARFDARPGNWAVDDSGQVGAAAPGHPRSSTDHPRGRPHESWRPSTASATLPTAPPRAATRDVPHDQHTDDDDDVMRYLRKSLPATRRPEFRLCNRPAPHWTGSDGVTTT